METKIDTEHITLSQFLKIENYISTGGQAKIFLQSNEVTVNDIPSQQRGKKLYSGDIIKLAGNIHVIKGN